MACVISISNRGAVTNTGTYKDAEGSVPPAFELRLRVEATGICALQAGMPDFLDDTGRYTVMRFPLCHTYVSLRIEFFELIITPAALASNCARPTAFSD